MTCMRSKYSNDSTEELYGLVLSPLENQHKTIIQVKNKYLYNPILFIVHLYTIHTLKIVTLHSTMRIIKMFPGEL